jgi:hypothetical protein
MKKPLLHWPGVTTLCLLAVAVVIGVDLLPRSVFDVTMSVESQTEVVELDLDPAREYVWGLPAGSYSLLVAGAAQGCETRGRFEVVCDRTGPSYVAIRNGGTARIEALPAGEQGDDAPRFVLTLTPRPAGTGAASTFELRAPDNALLATTHDLVSYESQSTALWRIPLVVRRVQIGESLAENVIAPDAATARQPIMTQGNVRIFARRIFGGSNRYQVQEEQFDPADVVQIPGEPAPNALLLGLLAFKGNDHAFDVTLHTSLAKVLVRRLGAEHAIGASMWSIVSRDPASLALWAALVALIGIANYHSARLNNKLARAAKASPSAPRWRPPRWRARR